MQLAHTVPQHIAPSVEQFSEKQISASCNRIKSGIFTDKDIAAAIYGLKSGNEKTYSSSIKALSGVDRTLFKEAHFLSLISTINGDGGQRDIDCANLLYDAAIHSRILHLPFGPNFKDELISELGKQGLKFDSYGDSSVIEQQEKLFSINEGTSMDFKILNEYYSYLSLTAKRYNGRVSIYSDKPEDFVVSKNFSQACRDALIEKIWSVSVSNNGIFLAGQKEENSAASVLARTAFKSFESDYGGPEGSNALSTSQTTKMLKILNEFQPSSHVLSSSFFFDMMEKNIGAITREQYVLLISNVEDYYYSKDSLIRKFAEKHQNDGLLTHDDIEIYKEGMRNRDAADTYAANFRHVDRYYAKLVKKEDLQIFIDNIDQEKPEYCSGELCGCKARAIADLANILPHFFTDEQVDTVINTFKTSTTYRDGAAMILGYLAVNEPDRFGEKCVNALVDGLKNDSHEYDSAIMLLNAALKCPEIYGETVRDIFLDGLTNAASQPQSLWALQKLSKDLPELFTNVNSETGAKIDVMATYSLSKQKELDILNQYDHFEAYFDLGLFDMGAVNKRINSLSNEIDEEKERKKIQQE